MPPSNLHILFVTGGSGGHIYPMLAVLDAVQAQSPTTRCSYVGTAADMQSPAIRGRDQLEKYTIHTGKLHRFWTLKNAREFIGLGQGFLEAQRLIKRLQPDLIFAKGGAVSVPIVAAAARLGIPIFSHETDVRSGLANRFAARFATTIFTAYPAENYPTIPLAKIYYVGQPIRPEFYIPATADIHADSRIIAQDLPLITVIGGSQGAKGLNTLVVEHWSDYLQLAQLFHICGPSDLEPLRMRAAKLTTAEQQRLFLVAYQHDGLPAAFQRSRVVINRAGGTAIELAASRSASVLVPLASAAQDHQRANAAVLLAAGAAMVVQESEGADALYTVVEKLFNNSEKQQRIRQNISSFARAAAAKDIAAALLISTHE